MPLLSAAYALTACPMLRRLERHLDVLACWRARASAGRRMPISAAMMPITTSNSTRVKPFVRVLKLAPPTLEMNSATPLRHGLAATQCLRQRTVRARISPDDCQNIVLHPRGPADARSLRWIELHI